MCVLSLFNILQAKCPERGSPGHFQILLIAPARGAGLGLSAHRHHVHLSPPAASLCLHVHAVCMFAYRLQPHLSKDGRRATGVSSSQVVLMSETLTTPL